MTNIQFKATLEMLVPLVIKEIEKNRGITGREAFELLYSSFLYIVIVNWNRQSSGI